MIRIYDTNKIFGSKLVSINNFLLNEININLSKEFLEAKQKNKKIFIPHVVSKEILGRLDAYKKWLENKIEDKSILEKVVLKIDSWIEYFQSNKILLSTNFWNENNNFFLKLIYEDSLNKTIKLLNSGNKKIPKDLCNIKDAIILRELEGISRLKKTQYAFISSDEYFINKIEIQHFYNYKADLEFNYIRPDQAKDLNKQIYDELYNYYNKHYLFKQIEIDNNWNYIDSLADMQKTLQEIHIDVKILTLNQNNRPSSLGNFLKFYEKLFVKIIYENDCWKILSINNVYGEDYYTNVH